MRACAVTSLAMLWQDRRSGARSGGGSGQACAFLIDTGVFFKIILQERSSERNLELLGSITENTSTLALDHSMAMCYCSTVTQSQSASIVVIIVLAHLLLKRQGHHTGRPLRRRARRLLGSSPLGTAVCPFGCRRIALLERRLDG